MSDEFKAGDKVSFTHHYDEVTGTVAYYSEPLDIVRIEIPTPGGQTETITRHVSNHGLTLVEKAPEVPTNDTEELPYVEPEPDEAA